MAYMNEKLWQKAYMLEFLEDTTSVDVFTFSVPPESEDLDFPQRVSETKTFGGAVFDDYGNDTIHITLSGTTINEEEKYIYCGAKEALSLTGEREIFHLQNLLQKWGDLEQVKKNKKIYLYDLSKMNAAQRMTGTTTRNYWRVFIKDFKIKRSKDKPFTFCYTLDMIGVLTEKNTFSAPFEKYSEVIEKAMKGVEKLQKGIDKAQIVINTVDNVLDNLWNLKKSFESMKNPSVLKIASAADSALRIVTGNSNHICYSTAKTVMKHMQRLKSLAKKDGKISLKEGKTFRGESSIVSFDTLGGSVVPSQVVRYLELVSKPFEPEKKRCSFTGWFADKTCSELFNFLTEIDKNTTLYAGWVTKTIVVTVNPKNGKASYYVEIPKGSCLEIPVTPTKKDSVFMGWCTDNNCENPFDFAQPVNEDMTIYAKWISGYQIVFNSMGGDEVETQLIHKNERVIYPLTPNKKNYQFAGWYTDELCLNEYDFSLPVTSSFELFAAWVKFANFIKFESYGGSPVEVQSVNIGEKIIKPADPVREGYTFIFWCDDVNASNEFFFDNFAVYGSKTLYARWQRNLYNVSFDTNGGSLIEDSKIYHGELVPAPIRPFKENYVFDKWCTDAELQHEFDFDTPITANITLYAKWFRGAE